MKAVPSAELCHNGRVIGSVSIKSDAPKPHHREAFVVSKQTMDLMLKDERAPDLVALYCFYTYVALWQETNQPKATIHYVAHGLRWCAEKVRLVKARLVKLGLIEDIKQCNEKTGKVVGWYVRVRYYHPTEKPKGGDTQVKEGKNHPQVFTTPGEKPQCGSNHRVVFTATNALSSGTKMLGRAGTKPPADTSSPKKRTLLKKRTPVLGKQAVSFLKRKGFCDEHIEILQWYHSICCADPKDGFDSVDEQSPEVSRAFDDFYYDMSDDEIREKFQSAVDARRRGELGKEVHTFVGVTWRHDY